MLLKKILTTLEFIAPLRAAESWDNVGLLTGDPQQSVHRILLTIDYTPTVAVEARNLNCDLIIAYHPPIFSALKRITGDGPTGLIHDAIRRGVAMYSPHTAWDAAVGGTNDFLADLLGLVDRQPLRLVSPPVNEHKLITFVDRVMTALRQSHPYEAPVFDLTVLAAPPSKIGPGRSGQLESPISVGKLVARIKKELKLTRLLIAGDQDRTITTAAVCAGAGGELLDDAICAKAELYLTGELRHHDALKAIAAGMTVFCTLHSNSERPSLTRLKARLEALLPDVPEVLLSQTDRDPFAVV